MHTCRDSRLLLVAAGLVTTAYERQLCASPLPLSMGCFCRHCLNLQQMVMMLQPLLAGTARALVEDLTRHVLPSLPAPERQHSQDSCGSTAFSAFGDADPKQMPMGPSSPHAAAGWDEPDFWAAHKEAARQLPPQEWSAWEHAAPWYPSKAPSCSQALAHVHQPSPHGLWTTTAVQQESGWGQAQEYNNTTQTHAAAHRQEHLMGRPEAAFSQYNSSLPASPSYVNVAALAPPDPTNGMHWSSNHHSQLVAPTDVHRFHRAPHLPDGAVQRWLQ